MSRRYGARVTMVSHTPEPDLICAQSAAICTGSKDFEKALRTALASGHESVAEHAAFTFRVDDVSRALLAQLTRHRIASYSVESQRYVDMGRMPMVVPDSIIANGELLGRFHEISQSVRAFYRDAVKAGIPKEDARYITPLGCKTRLIMTMNARELRHFFRLRMCHKAQWEIREVACAMYTLASGAAPILFEEAGPACIRGKCPEKKPCGEKVMEVRG